MTPEAEVVTAALALSDALLESLKHPKHAAILAPLRTKAEAVLKKFFARQHTKLMVKLKPRLRKLAASMHEAADDAHTKALAKAKFILPDSLLPLSITSGMAYDYGEILQSGISGAYEQLAEELSADTTISEDTVATYLRQNGLRKITGKLDQTTIDRLRNAIADAYEAGAGYDELVSAIQAEYEGFSSVRAGMIAQTELNNGYNWGRKLLGLDLGMTQKSWSCDGPNPCEICLGNQAEGWIGIEETFSSGDDRPSSHPNCFCSLDLRKRD